MEPQVRCSYVLSRNKWNYNELRDWNTLFPFKTGWLLVRFKHRLASWKWWYLSKYDFPNRWTFSHQTNLFHNFNFNFCDRFPSRCVISTTAASANELLTWFYHVYSGKDCPVVSRKYSLWGIVTSVSVLEIIRNFSQSEESSYCQFYVIQDSSVKLVSFMFMKTLVCTRI